MENVITQPDGEAVFAADEISALLLSAEALPEFAVTVQMMYSSLGTDGD
jgi:hypothetical protein